MSNKKLPDCYVNINSTTDQDSTSAVNSAKLTFTFDLKYGDGSKQENVFLPDKNGKG